MSKQRRSKSNSRKALAAALALALVPSLAHAATGDWTGSSGATTPRVPITPAICTTETVMLVRTHIYEINQ